MLDAIVISWTGNFDSVNQSFSFTFFEKYGIIKKTIKKRQPFSYMPHFIVKRCKEKTMDKKKADGIICEYLQKIYGFAIKKAFYHEEAEELSSEIVMEVYTTLLKSDEIYNLDGYVWRICNHVYAKFVSKKKKQEGVSIDGFEIPYEENFLTDDAEEEIRLLQREIAFLSKRAVI